MKNALIALTLLLSLGLAAQRTTAVTVEAPNCNKAIRLYTFNGMGFDLLESLTEGEAGAHTTTVTAPEARFYYVGTHPGDMIPVIIGEDDQMTISAKCGNFRNAIVTDSPVNVAYRRLKQQFQSDATSYSTAVRAYVKADRAGDETTVKQEAAALATLDEKKKKQLEKARKEFPILGRIAALNTYLSFANNNDGKYANELDFLVNTYFQFVDHQDPGYDNLNWTYEGNRNLANILAPAVPGTQLNELLMQLYDRWPAGSRAQMLAMSGGFAALSRNKHPGALGLAEATLERFKEKFPVPMGQLEQQIASLRTFAIGAEAPLFAGPTPEGDTLALAELRGKVVLLDFWASWCGPCRRENPKVVKVYEKYQDQGFEILGVSLDKTKNRWLQAIEADGLTWKHVSDLKGWKSAYSRLYGVSSIPHTVLLDREGRIIARNLRGKALENKLAEVFSAR